MPYQKEPRKVKGGWALVREDGTLHKSSKGKIVRFGSKAKAQRAKGYIAAHEKTKGKIERATRALRRRRA